MILEGRVWLFGDNVDTDAIIPARYLSTVDPAELARYCMEDLEPGFARQVQPGDLIVAGKNFGCGSSREHAPLALKGAGISCVVAQSFARIFYRNAVNTGLPILECREALAPMLAPREVLRVDLEQGLITLPGGTTRLQASPFPPFMQEIIRRGGLIEYVRTRLLPDP
jgi:3-isopropylmalate/(R)-2-methylmalate dehydratase small subunit